MASKNVLCLETGPDPATVEIMVVLWCGQQLRVQAILPTRTETETWQEALRSFGDRKSCSVNPATNEKCSRLLLCREEAFTAKTQLTLYSEPV